MSHVHLPRLMSDAADEDTVVDPPPVHQLMCRRQAPRFAPRPGARAEARALGSGGVEAPVDLLDVSEFGLRVQLGRPVRPGDMLEVTLREPGGRAVAFAVATVRWATRPPSGRSTAGVELVRPLAPGAVRSLAGALLPAGGPGGKDAGASPAAQATGGRLETRHLTPAEAIKVARLEPRLVDVFRACGQPVRVCEASVGATGRVLVFSAGPGGDALLTFRAAEFVGYADDEVIAAVRRALGGLANPS